MVPAGYLERHGRQCRSHLAQHAYARVGGSLRPTGHDDDVRNALDEFESGRHGATGDDDQAIPQLALHHFVVHGERRVDDDAAAPGRARDRRHDCADP